MKKYPNELDVIAILRLPATEVSFEDLELIITVYRRNDKDKRAVDMALRKEGGVDFLKRLIGTKMAKLRRVEHTDGFEDWRHTYEDGAGVLSETAQYIEKVLNK